MRRWRSHFIPPIFFGTCVALCGLYVRSAGRQGSATDITLVVLSLAMAIVAAWALYASLSRLRRLDALVERARGHGIRWQVGWLTALVGGPLVILVVYLVVMEARQAFVTHESHSLELARVKGGDLSRVMSEYISHLVAMAKRPQVAAMDPAACDPLQNDFSTVAANVTISVTRDLNGEPICPPPPPGRAFTNYANAPWYPAFVRGNDPHFTAPFVGPVSGDWMVNVLVPVDRDGRRVGSIDIGIRLARLANAFDKPIVEERAFVLFSADGTVLASDDLKRYGFGQPGANLPIVAPRLGTSVSEMRTIDHFGERVAVGYTNVTGTPWILAVAVPEPRLFVARFFSSMMLLLPLLGLAYAAAAYASYRIVRPIRNLTDAASRIAAGETERRMPGGGGSELRTLSDAINKMLDARESSVRALVASERRFKSAMFVAAPVYWEADGEGRVTHVLLGQGATGARLTLPKMVGCLPWEIAGTNPDALVWAQLREKLKAQHGYADLEFTLELPDRDPLVMSLTAQPLRDGAGALLGWQGVARDVTARARATQALRLYEAAISATTDGMVITTAETEKPGPHILYANQAFCHLTGYAAGEILGQTPRLFQGPLTNRSELDRVRAALIAEVPVDAETINYRKDGSAYEVAWKLAPLRDVNGVVTYWIGSMRDVTRVNAQARELAMNAAMLERRVEERTAVLTSTTRELEAFTYSVSHDLRAPLRVMEGFAEILSEDYGKQLDGVAQDHIKRIRAAAKRMNGMIDSLLALSRTAMSELKREETDLSQMAKEVFVDATAHLPKRDIQFDVTEGLIASADRSLMRNVVENLIGNAVKFTSKKALASIAFGQERMDGQLAYFVRDNGAGFDMRFSKRLFGAFQRLHSTADYVGTGIGLASVQRIIRRHGGEIWAVAEPNCGATFYFTLEPNDAVAAAAEDSPPASRE